MEALPCAGHTILTHGTRAKPTRRNASLRNEAHHEEIRGRESRSQFAISVKAVGQNYSSRSYHHTPVSCAASSFDLSPPPIDHDFLDLVAAAGATVSDNEVIETFGNDDEALEAAENGVAIVDLSHWGRIRVSGEDRIQFLHNQSTADFESLPEGQGCDTVFVTPTARTIDIAHTWKMKNAVLLAVSPDTRKRICEMLEKYIFFSDKVEIQDITSDTSLFALVGPESNKVMQSLGLGDLIGQPYGTHKHFTVNGLPITIGVGNIMSEDGYTMMLSPSAAASVWKQIVGMDVTPMGSNAWERLRILRGRPAAGKELTEEFNVLEAGLWNSISMNKGCYKGQETIARLITYDGVKQYLWGVTLSAHAEPGSPIIIDGKKVGKLTSCTVGRNESEFIGLGYVKRRAASRGDKVIVADTVVGTLVNLPYLAGQVAPVKPSNVKSHG